MTPVVMEDGGAAMARPPGPGVRPACPGNGTAVSGGLRPGGGCGAVEGRGTASCPGLGFWMGKTVWHLVHLSFAPPAGTRFSSRLYVALQEGHVTRIAGLVRLSEGKAGPGHAR
jgi:hypothetical protein